MAVYTAWSVVFGEQPSAAKWNLLGANDAFFDGLIGSGTAWTSWTPTYTNLTVGNGTHASKYQTFGKFTFYRMSFVLGSTSTVGTSVTFTWPNTAVSYPNIANDIDVVGYGSVLDSGTQAYDLAVAMATTTTGRLYIKDSASTSLKLTDITASLPMVWTTSDTLTASGFYESA